MKKILLTLILFMLIFTNVQAQLTNTSDWSYKDPTYMTGITNSTNITTNFYKLLVFYPNWAMDRYVDLVLNRTNYINAFPGETIYLPHYIYNVGSINEANGVTLSVGNTSTNITVAIYDAATNLLGGSTPAINAGASTEYLVGVTTTSNVSGTITATFFVTNTGSLPYPHRVIVKHTIRIINASIIVKEATDGIHTVTTFDGSQPLGNVDIKVYIQIPDMSQVVDVNSIKLYYDFNGVPDGSVPVTGNLNVNRAVQFFQEGDLWVATIPVTDPEFEVGNMLSYLVSVDGKLYDQNGMVTTTTNPWQISIREYVTQQPEGEHTISINNKFDPESETYHLIYKIDGRTHVNASIYNVRGELVRQIKNQEEDIGKYVVEWDGTNDDGERVAPGLYLVIIQTSEYGEIRKVLVIKR